MSKICIFCCKTCDQKSCEDKKANKKFSPASEFLKKFFIFLERYLGREKGPGAEFLQNFAKKKLFACEACIKITKSFCDLYNDLKTIELLLNWRLDTLKDVLISQDGNAQASSDTEQNELQEFRKALVQMCTHTQRNSFPRLELKKTAWKAVEKENSVENNIPKSITSKNDCDSNTDKSILSEESPKITDCSNSGKGTFPLESLSTFEDDFHPDEANVSEGEESLMEVDEHELVMQIKSEQRTEANVGSPDKEPSVLTFTTVKTDRVEPGIAKKDAAHESLTSSSSPPPTSSSKAKQSPPPRRLRNVHKCSSCSKTFSTLESLSAHKETTECGGNNGMEKWTGPMMTMTAQSATKILLIITQVKRVQATVKMMPLLKLLIHPRRVN